MSVTTALADVLPSEAIVAGASSGAWDALEAEPESIVRPSTTEDVGAVLSWAGAEGVGVVPVGSGHALGTRRPRGTFIVLSTARLSGVEEYEPADLTVTAGAGTPLAEIAARLGAHAQWLPVDPPSAPDRTLGGLVASGASGPLATGYGDLRNHVLGATVVSGDGRTLRLGGRVVKNVAGFDLLKPMVGSRGTLGVLTSVCVRVVPEPAVDRVLVLRGGAASELVVVARAVGTAPMMPVSCVLMSPAPVLTAGAALILRLHGAFETVAADQAALERHAGVRFESPENVAEVLEAARDGASAAPVVVRVCVLASCLGDALRLVRTLPEAEVVADAYGGRIRVGIAESGLESLSVVRASIEQLGGTVGLERAPRSAGLDGVVSARSADEVEIASRLEGVFDPEGVLWRHA